jgi:WD40 repeat protein
MYVTITRGVPICQHAKSSHHFCFSQNPLFLFVRLIIFRLIPKMSTTTTSMTSTTVSNDASFSNDLTTSTENEEDVIIIIHLPTEVLIGHVVPFLDRQSLSRFAATNKELLSATQRLSTLQLPWPTRLVSKNHHCLSTKIINCVGISPDGATIAAGGSDGSISRWNLHTGEETTTTTRTQQPVLEGGQQHCDGAVVAIAFSKDGRRMASASSSNTDHHHTIVLWYDDKIFKTIDAGQDAVTCLDFGPHFLASGHAQREAIKLWNLSHGTCDTEFRGRSVGGGKVETMQVSDDGRHIRVTADDGSIKLWNSQGSTYDFWVGGCQNAVGQSPTTGGLVIASVVVNNDIHRDDDDCLMLWNRERREHFQLAIEQHPRAFVFSPNAEKLAVVDHSNFVKIWNVETGRIESTCTIHQDEHAHSFDSLTFSSDSKWLVAISSRQQQQQQQQNNQTIRVMQT